MKGKVAGIVFGLLGLLCAQLGATELFPYLYQRSGFEYKGALTLEMENGLGTRDSGYFGRAGLETGVRFRYGLTDRFNIEGWTGFNAQAGRFRSQAFALEVGFGVLRQGPQPVNLSFSAGFKRDFEGVFIPLLRLTLSRAWGDFDFTLSGLGEFPQASWRDDADIIIGTGVSYKIFAGCRLGLEALGEDLEGFWEKNEAEGGAKFIVGPTAWIRIAKGLECKINAGWVHAATTNIPTRPDLLGASARRDGFLARVAFSVSL